MISIQPIVVTPLQQNARIITVANECVIVDPGGDASRILAAIPRGVTVSELWITHSHIDHVGGVAHVLQAFPNQPICVVAHVDDAINRQALALQSNMMGVDPVVPFEVTHAVTHGDSRSIGGMTFQVLHTPGHAIGHVAYYLSDSNHAFEAPILISGDALFKGSIGRTDLPGGNYDQLMDSIHGHFLPLPDHTIVCSGHGPNTTIGHEKQTNPFLLDDGR